MTNIKPPATRWSRARYDNIRLACAASWFATIVSLLFAAGTRLPPGGPWKYTGVALAIAAGASYLAVASSRMLHQARHPRPRTEARHHQDHEDDTDPKGNGNAEA